MRRVLLPHHFSGQPAPADGVILDFRGHSMGTSWMVRLVESGDGASLRAGIQAQLDAVVAQMSHWQEDSDLGRFNRAAAGSWHGLPAGFAQVLGFALEVSQASGGAYDPCAGALVNRWGFGPGGGFDQPGFAPPTPEQAAALAARVAGARIEFDAAGRRARQPGGALLDLSAVAKGYGVDCVARYLAARGVVHYLVEVGGELRGAGTKPDGQPWWVGLEQVADADAAAHPRPVALALHQLSVATSGDYRRYFSQGRRRYSHTIDPRSGAPIANDLASVTVLHAQCMAADAWSTALTVLGLRDGLALAERLGLAARFLVRGDAALDEHMSSAMRLMLEQ